MMDRNTLTALLLIAVVLILTPYYLQVVSPTERRTTDDSLMVEGEGTPPLQTIDPEEPPSSRTEKQLVVPRTGAVDEKVFSIESDLYFAEISSRAGGSINSFILKKYLGPDSNYVDLIDDANRENLSIQAKNLDAELLDLSSPWRIRNVPYTERITAPTSITFFTSIYKNKEITKTITFYPDSYLLDIEIDLSSCSEELLSGLFSFSWYGGLPSTEKNTSEDQTYFSSYVYQGGELDDIKASQGENILNSYKGSLDWAVIRTKYFLTSFIPNDPTVVISASIGASYNDRETYDMSLFVPSNDLFRTSVYLGPLEYSRINQIGKDLDLVMNFGWFIIVPISKGVLWLLKNMHSYIPNYGFVLILFSILIKVVVYPLTKKSYQSTRAMQALQPEVAALKEKLKANPQKLNQATMALYKKRGVNPLGGCLPMLLQMPLLFALFTVFRTTIELRGEPFILWIKDLSAPDVIFDLPFSIPIYGDFVCALPILMAFSMFIQQKMMTGGAEQQAQQKMMQYFMMAFFFLIFNSFPSGLNLYYTLFNVLTILQQKYVSS